jgi:anti-anti-sigma factor
MKFEKIILEDGIKQIKLVGRLDIQGTKTIDPQFSATTSAEKAPVLVDLSEVEFLSSVGMQMLLYNAKALAKQGGVMVLLKPIPMVKEALKIVGFDALIPIYDDFDEACAVLRATSHS